MRTPGPAMAARPGPLWLLGLALCALSGGGVPGPPVGDRKSCRDHSKTIYMIKPGHRGLERHWNTILRL